MNQQVIIVFVAIGFTCCLAAPAFSQHGPMNEAYLDFNYGQDTGGDEWAESIEVLSPALRSEIQGPIQVVFKAPGMTMERPCVGNTPQMEIRISGVMM